MALAVPRILVTNRVRERVTILTASSQQTSLPVDSLRDQMRTDIWRSKSGWTISPGFNDKIDWSRGGTFVATLTAGNYGTGADLAAEIQARMQAADGGATYTVEYNTTTFKFRIVCSASIVLKWSTGANVATSAGKDLGYDVSADDTGTSLIADNVSYQSRHWVKADLGSALLSQVAVVINHNAGTGGTFRHQANATDAWTAPTLNQVLAGDAAIRLAYFADQTLRYGRLVIEDVQNPLGYSELGIWFAGPYTQLSVAYSDELVDDPEELSKLAYAYGGAHFVDEQGIREAWRLKWKEIPTADMVLMDAVRDATPSGRNFFFSFDAVGDPTDTLYGFRAGSMPKDFVPIDYWNVSFLLAEALG